MKQVTKLLRHAGAAASVVIVLALFSSCAPTTPAASSPPPAYDAAIVEGRTSAQAALDGGVSAITIALVDARRIVWSQAFGLANRETQQAPSATTMFGIGSVTKVLTAVAVMKLVDRGVVDLDKPLVTYLPAFKMASAGYESITVRMLLNHSTGFPGTDYRGALARSAIPGYQNQVLETLSTARLKAPPGFMSVYCNDCFAVAGALIEATSGKSYVQFVQDEILDPLGMASSRFPLGAFPAGSFALSGYASGAPRPQEYVNTLASGALYSTADDLGRLAMMFLGGGAVDTTRILSAAAVAEMAVDQTARSFNPIRNDSCAYGLGWDTVTQPGLGAVGFQGWAKGGDSNDYGAGLLVSPQAELGVVVIAAGGGSSLALAIAERVLLRALAEKGGIANVPSALPAVAPPAAPVPEGLLASITGEYAQGGILLQVEAQPDGALTVWLLSDTGRAPAGPSSTYRQDGWFVSDADPLRAFKVVDVDLMGQPAQYLVSRAPGAAHGHYVDGVVFAQRVRSRSAELPLAWKNRVGSTWLVVNAHPDELAWSGVDPRLRLSAPPAPSGLLALRAPVDPAAPAGRPDTRIRLLDPSAGDTTAPAARLVVPQLNGRDLEELTIEMRAGAEWARLGSYLHRPLATVPPLAGGSTAVTIGPEGHAEWRAVARVATPVTIAITGTGAWQLYDANFTSVAHGTGSAAPSLPAGDGLGYLTVFGAPGETVTVAVP